MTFGDELRAVANRQLLDYNVDNTLFTTMRAKLREAAAYIDVTDSLIDEIPALIRVGTGKLAHAYLGLCPDEVEGYDSRDPKCPACQVLIGVIRD